ncbi:MAG: hypothetical protein ACRD0Q_04190 [Acidimicrobiales bacterium]
MIVLADLLVLTIGGELPSERWWWVAVPVGVFLVPVVGAVCLVALVGQRRRTRLPSLFPPAPVSFW